MPTSAERDKKTRNLWLWSKSLKTKAKVMTITTLAPISSAEAYLKIADNMHLSGKQIAALLDVSTATASRKIKLMKAAYKLTKYKKITLLAVCTYFELDVVQAVNKVM
jgi:hypothetical protein